MRKLHEIASEIESLGAAIGASAVVGGAVGLPLLPVDRLEHSLQTATRAHRAGAAGQRPVPGPVAARERRCDGAAMRRAQA